MKKSLLVISVILLIAGLFISCNSEAAESNNGLVEVKFAESASKALNSSTSVPEAQLPEIEDQYWWYRATKTTAGAATGAKTKWTRVKATAGLANTSVGKFSLGGWRFDLIAVGTDADPETWSAKPNYDGSAWSNTTNLVYWGSAGTTLTTSNTTVSVPLNGQTPAEEPSTVILNNVVLFNNEVTATSTNWVWKAYIDNTQKISGTIGMSETGEKKITSETVANNVEVGVHTIGIKVFESSESTDVLFSAEKAFVAFSGSTITISGSLEETLSGDVFFEGDNSGLQPVTHEAYTYNSTSYTKYPTFVAALTAAQDGDTVALLTDVTISLNGRSKNQHNLIEDFFIEKSLTIEGNGHTINASYTYENGTPTKQTMNTAFLYVDGNVTVNMSNLTINSTGSSYAVVYDDGADGEFNNVIINGDNICASAASTSSRLTVNGGSLNFTKASTTRPDYNPRDCVPVAAQYGGEVVLNGTTLTGTNGGAISVWPSGGSVTANNCAIDSTVFTTLAWICNGNANTPANSIISLNNCTITGGTTPGDSGLSQHNAIKNATDTCGHHAEVRVNGTVVASCHPHEN